MMNRSHRKPARLLFAAAVLVTIVGTTRAAVIQSWIDAASPGDTIVIPDGTYFESLTIATPNLTLAAAAGASPVINAGGTGDAITLNAAGLVLRGLEVTGATSGRGLVVNVGSSATLRDVSLTGNQVNVRVVSSPAASDAASLTLDGGNTITNTAATTAGLVFSGLFAGLGNNSFNETAFITPALGGPDLLIRLENQAFNGPVLLPAGDATFNGIAGLALTPTEFAAVETQIRHFADDFELGLVDLNSPSFIPEPSGVSLIFFAAAALLRRTRRPRPTANADRAGAGGWLILHPSSPSSHAF